MHKIIFFSQKNNKKKYVSTLPKVFRPITQNTFFLFGLNSINSDEMPHFWDITHGSVLFD